MFTIKELGFDLYHGSRLKKTDRINGNIAFITAGKENKGVIGNLGNKDIQIYHNPITIDMFGNCFYHNIDCSGDDNIYFFINNNLSSNVKLYISCIINSKIKDLYSYAKQFRQNDAENLTISLSINEDGKPDFQFIEKYMEEIESKQKAVLNLLNI